MEDLEFRLFSPKGAKEAAKPGSRSRGQVLHSNISSVSHTGCGVANSFDGAGLLVAPFVWPSLIDELHDERTTVVWLAVLRIAGVTLGFPGVFPVAANEVRPKRYLHIMVF